MADTNRTFELGRTSLWGESRTRTLMAAPRADKPGLGRRQGNPCPARHFSVGLKGWLLVVVLFLLGAGTLFLTEANSGVSGQVVLLTCASAARTPDPSCPPADVVPVPAQILIQSTHGSVLARINSSDGSFHLNLLPGSYFLIATGTGPDGNGEAGNLAFDVKPFTNQRVTVKMVSLGPPGPCRSNLACG